MKILPYKERQAKCSEYRASLKKKATNSEIKFAELLDKLKIRYLFQKGFIKDYFCIVDFYIPSLKLVVEIDGGYHQTEEQIKKDKNRDNYLKKIRKFNVLRFTNQEIDNMSVDSLKDILNTFSAVGIKKPTAH